MTTFYHQVLTKACNECHIEKPISDFETGATKCKQCRNEQRRQRVKRQIASGDIPPTRVCQKCQKEKITTKQFYKHSHGPFGYARICKECTDARKKAWAEAHSEEENARKAAIYTPEERRQYNQAYYEVKQEHLNEQCQLYYEEHKGDLRPKRKAWQQANLLKCRESNDRRRARKRNATVEKVSYEAILARDGYWCYICEGIVSPEDVGFDHVIPLEREGAHVESNIRICHRVCNSRKGTNLLSEMSPFQRRGIN